MALGVSDCKGAFGGVGHGLLFLDPVANSIDVFIV